LNASLEIEKFLKISIPPQEILKRMYKYWNLDNFEVFLILIKRKRIFLQNKNLLINIKIN
jgi:hypothetical protein